MVQNIYLETTTVCNLHCTMCPRFGWEEVSSHPDIMPVEVFTSLRPYFASLRSIAFVGCGEPTTDRRLLQFISEAAQAGVYTMFTTNGMFLDKVYSAKIIQSGLMMLGVSFDGATPDTFESIRNGSSFQKVVQNLRNFIELREQTGTRPLVKVQIVLMRRNLNELSSIVVLASDLRVEEVYAKNLCFLRTHDLISESLQENFNPEIDVNQRNRYIAEALAAARQRNLRLVLPSYRNSSEIGCPYHPQNTLFIRRNGDVFPCPIYAVWNYGVERNIILEKRMGNVLEQPLMNIWSSKRYRAFRNRFAAGAEELCTGCTVWSQGYQEYSPKPIHSYIY
jgi:Fe-coproporphyrin III synthase